MALSELLPALHGLSRVDKLQVIQVLAMDVAREERGNEIVADQAYPIWSPYESFAGAATLLEMLDEEDAG
ncbi:MAG: hypothetical protein ACOCWL_01780 [Thermoguttaceae bacterium]